MKLSNMTDVDASGVKAGQVLALDEPSQKWKPHTLATPNQTRVFADAAAVAAAVPEFIGQLGVQIDTGRLWYGTALTAGSWSVPNVDNE